MTTAAPAGPRAWAGVRPLLVGVAVLAVLGGVLAAILWRGVHLRLTQAELQAQLRLHFPLDRACGDILIATFSDPVLTLHRDVATVAVHVDAGVVSRSLLAADLALTAAPRYVPAEGALYLDHPVLTTLSVEHGPRSLIEHLRPAFTAILAYEFARRPAYTLDPRRLSQACARQTVRRLRIEEGALTIDLGLP